MILFRHRVGRNIKNSFYVFENSTDSLSDSYLLQKYKQFNKLFFSSKLPLDIIIAWSSHATRGSFLGFTKHRFIEISTGNDFPSNIDADLIEEGVGQTKPIAVLIVKHSTLTMKQIDEILLHEMCHVYQSQVLLNGDLAKYRDAYKDNKGHGESFKEAARLVDKSPENVNGYSIKDTIPK